jgi:tetratricopeptide (TPR) repeat protein
MAERNNTFGLDNGRWPKALVLGLALAVLVISLNSMAGVKIHPSRTATELLESASTTLKAGRFEDAEFLAASIPRQDLLAPAALMIAGESATRRGDSEAAIAYYSQISEQAAEYPNAIYALGELYRSENRWVEAIDSYRKTLRAAPSNLDCKERLAFILGASGQRFETIPLFMDLVRAGRWSIESLAVFADIERPIEQLDLVVDGYEQNRSDPVIQLSRASHYIIDGELKSARALLQPLVFSFPDLIAAQEHLGEVLFGLGDFQTMAEWNAALPRLAEESPQIWFLRGRLARHYEQMELAAGCFGKSLELAPEHRQATYHLGQVLSKLNHPQAAEIVRRAELQAELGQQLDQALSSKGTHQPNLKMIAERCLELGRFLEAQAWAQTSAQDFGPSEWSSQIIQKTRATLSRTTPRTLPEFHPVEKYSIRTFIGLASKAALSKLVPRTQEFATNAISPSEKSQVRFRTEEKNVELNFSYFNGPDASTKGVRMFEQTGGGTGVMDYDNDGYPDIFFSQGANWKNGEDVPSPNSDLADALYRNIGGTGFKEIASSAGIVELNFGQGVACADVNHDGFDDLLVCNIGQSRLFINQGDGTFDETTEKLMDQREAWGTSACIVDLNRDGFPDIYKLNYVQGKDVYSLICNGKGCSPSVFDGSPNQCWLNLGDGSFTLVENADGEPKFSKSLGIVAFVLEGDRHPSLFIANDQVRNFLLRIESASHDKLQISDESLVRGLAFNVDGLPLASMGIAADDIDNNGGVDLLSTNFANEANSLYMQDSFGFFTDAIGASAMQMASYPYVGWGTQFLDADRDSFPDAVVVNGHVDDYSDKGQGYEMVAQFFRNIGNGQFSLQSPDRVGDYFRQLKLGRSLARIDWNRDGLMEFVVSNMNSSAALLTNETTSPGNYLNLHLVGTSSARYPVGSVVRVTTDIGSWKKQITSGDGFQCSNQKLLQFGLGQSSQIQSVEISWPSGGSTVFKELAPNASWIIVEGCDQPYRLDY